MGVRPRTRIGEGRAPTHHEGFERSWPGVSIRFRQDEIRRPTDWKILGDRHAVVLHLDGRMSWLETELDGFGGSCGPALPGEVWTVPAGRAYASHAQGESIRYAVLRLDPEWLERAFDFRAGGIDFAAVGGTHDEFLHRRILALQQWGRRTDDAAMLHAESLVDEICLHLFRSYGEADTPSRVERLRSPQLTVGAARMLREFVYDHLSDRITLADLSSLVRMTPHHLLIAFQKAFGTTPAQFVIRQRLRQVRRELRNGDRDISTIALEAGFASHSHLCAAFRSRFGQSPGSYRRASKHARIDLPGQEKESAGTH